MKRPEKIYLDNEVVLPGNIKIHHTPEGLAYLIDHYTVVLAAVPIEDKIRISDSMREFITAKIGMYGEHIKFYEAGLVNVPA